MPFLKRRRAVQDPQPGPERPAPPRDWVWIRNDGGPDAVFHARFTPEDAARLAAAVAAEPLPGFLPVDEVDGLTYADEWTSEKLADQRRTGQRKNIWIFHQIRVTGSEVTVVRGYGGHPEGPCGATETALLGRLAGSPGLTLLDWEVRYEDAGEHLSPVAAGTSAASLLSFLQGDYPAGGGPAAAPR